jgi:hypothetical protein
MNRREVPFVPLKPVVPLLKYNGNPKYSQDHNYCLFVGFVGLECQLKDSAEFTPKPPLLFVDLHPGGDMLMRSRQWTFQ